MTSDDKRVQETIPSDSKPAEFERVKEVQGIEFRPGFNQVDPFASQDPPIVQPAQMLTPPESAQPNNQPAAAQTISQPAGAEASSSSDK